MEDYYKVGIWNDKVDELYKLIMDNKKLPDSNIDGC